MKTYTKEEVLKQYEESCEIMYQSTLSGNYRANNREGKKLIKIFKHFEKNREFAMECIGEMFKSENVVVRTEAAAYCLSLKENIGLAEKVLAEIANDESNGIFGFNAKMTLKVWKENDYLILYQGQEV